MNLYSSFGSILESWVTNSELLHHSSESFDGAASQDHSAGGDSDDSLTFSRATPEHLSKSDLGPLVESDAEDSAVEMASSEASLPSSPYFLLPGKTDMAPNSTAADRDDDRHSLSSLRPHAFTRTSSCSSSFTSGAMLQKVEQALLRADSDGRLQGLRHRRQWHTASLPPAQRTAHIQRTGNGSASGHPERTFSLSVVDEQSVPEMLHRRGDTHSHHKSLPGLTDTEVQKEDVCEEEEKEVLSPGLGYLEQVCRMMEEIARLRMEVEALKEQNLECDRFDGDTAGRCDRSASKRCPDKTNEDKPSQSSHSSNGNQYFRRRSASDTRVIRRHLSKVKRMSDGQYLSVDDINEQPNDDKEPEKKEAVKKKTENKTNTWRMRIGSLKRETTGKTSQPNQSSATNTSGNRLVRLFSRRKTVPIFEEQNVINTDSH
ncbi:hypothetical protein DPEC_G00336520 [Dallia pectoralis]|uniref:Uncharacterized protein n=1 Tax=Dallia pectoralis TaxID=75939 RepID=A0ACC2F797_DALPE|nr:hypothetical protein DPEC_G00336520 [Dallia pectoralis]